MVRQVLRHHSELVFRAPSILWEASKGWTTITAFVSLCLLFNKKLAEWGYNLIGTISPLWALVPIGLLFLYGLMQANYEKFRQVETKTALDVSRLKRYESRDHDRIVFESSPKRDHGYWPINNRDAEGYSEHLVPYDGAFNGLPGSRTTFGVGALGGEFSVVLGHNAYEHPDPRDWSQPVEPFGVETYLYVVRCSDGEESAFMRLCVFSERDMLPMEEPRPYRPRWGYMVSATVRLVGLPEGKYGLEVHDRTNAPGRGIIYRNMHLAMYILSEQ